MTPKEKHKVAQLLASGVPQKKIAQKLGCSQPNIAQFKKRNSDLVEKEAIRYQKSLPDIITTNQIIIRTAKGLAEHAAYPTVYPNFTIFQEPKDVLKTIELSAKISSNLLKAVGIEASPVQSQTYIQINNKTDGVTAPEVMALLDVANQQADVIDVDLKLEDV